MTPAAAPPSWLLLVHQLPPRPLYLRAKIRNRLARVGALPLKNSVYVLPDSEDAREDFAWIAQEARAGGGEAFVTKADFVEGVSSKDLAARFRREREAEQRRREAEAMLNSREHAPRRSGRAAPPARSSVRLRGRIWVTRRGIKVDRMASAWLVRRFLDPSARFRFVDQEHDVPRPRELRFDMAGGDFTHEGDRCTFETLLVRAGLEDPALVPIAEIVHDVDLKDGKFSRPEAVGVKRLVEGIVASHAADEDRLARGLALFDDLYASFRTPPAPAKARKRAKG